LDRRVKAFNFLESIAPLIGEEPHFEYCIRWLATVDNVKTKILLLNEEIIIPELSF